MILRAFITVLLSVILALYLLDPVLKPHGKVPLPTSAPFDLAVYHPEIFHGHNKHVRPQLPHHDIASSWSGDLCELADIHSYAARFGFSRVRCSRLDIDDATSKSNREGGLITDRTGSTEDNICLFLGPAPMWPFNEGFVMVLDETTNMYEYLHYDRKQFFSTKDLEWDVTIGNSTFGTKGVNLNINSDNVTLFGSVVFDSIVSWPSSLLAAGAMGPFGFLPFLECYHGIIALDAKLSGSLILNGETIDFSGGRAYIEKDWGTNFPSRWIWIQSSSFGDNDSVLSVSLATVPLGPLTIDGYIVGLKTNGYLYMFTTYTGSYISKIEVADTFVKLELVSEPHVLQIEVSRNQTKGSEPLWIHAPSLDSGRMTPFVPEELNAIVCVRLSEIIKVGGETTEKVIFEGKGTDTGLEVVGDVEKFVAKAEPQRPS